ncbi:MAG: hypothetical protein AB2A00_25385 [Myxococcota bacterium]
MRALHEGLDDLAVNASRLRPVHELRLRVGPLDGDPNLPVRGLPDVAPLSVPLGNRKVHLTLPSPIRGLDAPNDALHLDVVPPKGDSRGVVIFSPFWQIPSPWALTRYLKVVKPLGLHAVIYTPPDHMKRTPPGYFSGERLLGWDFPYMQQMLRVAAGELTALAKGLAAQGKPVYLVGLSLGGIYAAMAALGGAPLSGLALITPAADVQESMGRTPIGERYRKLLARSGDKVPSDELLTELGFPFRPRSFERPLDAERIFLAHGVHDAVVPFGVAEALAESWQVPLRGYPCGHMSLLFLEPEVRSDLGKFLQTRLARDAAAPVASPQPAPEPRLTRHARHARRVAELLLASQGGSQA